VKGKGRNPSRDEVALLAQANAEERRIREAGTVIEDPLLQPFLDAVAARLCVSFGIDASLVRVLALRDSSENAGALPNGVLIVYSGLFARLDNEAQLAGVLAHLLERLVARHALKSRRSAKTAAGFGFLGAMISPALLGAPIVAVEPHRSAGQNADQILAADRAALLAMVAAGYDGEQMIAAMQALEPGTSHSSPARPTGYPPTAVRIARMREQLAAMRTDGRLRSDARVGRQEYQTAVGGVLTGTVPGLEHLGSPDRPADTPNRN
jgi:predicted Zn-dependent protease